MLRDRNVLLVDDEVQVGLWRTGRMFGIENWNIVPDMIAIAKAAGGGLPLGAMLAKREIVDAWEPGSHSTTMGGNPVACVAGLATLETILTENLHHRAVTQGAYIMRRLKDMMDEHEIVGDIRGKGLIVGVELVKDRKTKVPAVEETRKVIRASLGKGLILMGAGTGSVNVIRILPALNIPRDCIDEGLDILDEALSEVETA
jgi:4-aminobutyrate aminotransferase